MARIITKEEFDKNNGIISQDEKFQEMMKFFNEQKIKYDLNEWNLDFINAKKTLGLCNYSKKMIFISKSYYLLNDIEEIKKTILHEMAHALTPESHHNYRWQKKCIEIGGDGRRTDKDATIAEGKYTLICKKCGKTYQKYREIKRKYACTPCCNKYNYGRYSEKYILEVKQNY